MNGIKQKDVEDIFRIRILLEGLCARWAVERITDEQLSRMEEIILLSEFHTKHENPVNIQQVMELDGQFHAVLYEASGSKILGSTLKDFHRYVQSARRTSVSSADRARKSIREHRLIFKAVRERDENLAEQLAQEHIIHVMENLKMGG